MAKYRNNINTFDINYRLKIDHDLDPSVDDISMPNGQHKISFCFKSNKVILNNGGKNVTSAKKYVTLITQKFCHYNELFVLLIFF